MNNRAPKPDLELIEDLRFEQSEWKVQRIAWTIMALLVAMGLIGLFGVGPLSSNSITSTDGRLKLEYDRFERWQAPSALRVILRPTDESRTQLWISSDFLGTVKLESIVPPPQSTEAQPGGTTYTFQVPSREPLVIVFHMQTEKMGNHPIELRANGAPALWAPHWVYP